MKTAESQPVDALERRSLEQIEHLVARASQMAAEETDRDRFYECLLDSAVHASGALAGAVWMRSETHGFELRNELNFLAAGMGEEGEWRESHDRMLEAVVERKAMLAATPSGPDSTAHSNATPFTMILSPVVCDNEVRVVVATIHQPHRSPLEQRGAERIVATMSAFAEEFQRNEQLRELQARELSHVEEEVYAKAVHRSRRFLPTAYAIANEGRRLLGCDRVSVARWRAGRARLLAVSGVDEIESRSNAVTCLEALCTRVAQSKEPLAYQAGHTDSLPPQLEEVLNAYVDHEHARSVYAAPLFPEPGSTLPPDSPLAIVLIESYAENAEQRTDRRNTLLEHAAIALTNAVETESRWIRYLKPRSLLMKVAAAACVLRAGRVHCRDPRGIQDRGARRVATVDPPSDLRAAGRSDLRDPSRTERPSSKGPSAREA